MAYTGYKISSTHTLNMKYTSAFGLISTYPLCRDQGFPGCSRGWHDCEAGDILREPDLVVDQGNRFKLNFGSPNGHSNACPGHYICYIPRNGAQHGDVNLGVPMTLLMNVTVGDSTTAAPMAILTPAPGHYIDDTSASKLSETLVVYEIRGLTVASRLAENNKVNVLVLESGQYAEDFPEVFIPGLVGTGLEATDLNWNYNTVPQANLNNRPILFKAGKGLGGSTLINGMLFPRAQKEQYDAWGTLNNDSSWTWDALLPFFKKSEIFEPPNAFQASHGAQYLPKFHGLNPITGRVKVGFPNFFFPQAELLGKTALGLGFRATPDLSNGKPEAIGVSSNSIDASNNTRCSAACAYYDRMKNRPNFKVITNATVSRIVWSSARNGSSELIASGVEYFLQNQTSPVVVNVTGEVILSAGTMGSPKVLELSGVGNSTILKAAGVEPVLEHATVGENLSEHVRGWVAAFTNASITNDMLTLDPAFAQQQLDLWYKNRTGLYSAGSARTLAIVPPSQIFSDSRLKDLINEARTNLSRGGTAANQRPKRNYTTLVVVLYAPLARGRSHIGSSSPFVSPLIDPAFWSHPLDVTAHIAGLKLGRKMLGSPPLDSINEGEFEPGLNVTSDEDVEKFMRSGSSSDFHPVGTMAMMPKDLGGVVDTELRVYGTRNVRVVDASIIPFPLSAHISSTVYMIGEKAAEIIKKDHRE
ncbi:alcohol oxidase [Marasmius fiardii PR-910]|nr:alcohol oxidase [Marasmius fiardii PR-910]